MRLAPKRESAKKTQAGQTNTHVHTNKTHQTYKEKKKSSRLLLFHFDEEFPYGANRMPPSCYTPITT